MNKKRREARAAIMAGTKKLGKFILIDEEKLEQLIEGESEYSVDCGVRSIDNVGLSKEWQVGSEHEEVFIESEDFTHDVRLYVNGDFADIQQRIEYAKTLAEKLNYSMDDTQ